MYFYYGGIIYCIMKNFNRAFYFFHSAISTTGSVISEILLEAFKKYILVSLLVYGKVKTLPKQNQHYLNRCCKPLVLPYYELANAYIANSSNTLEKIVAEHKELFTNDTNLGLVKQVTQSLYKVKIQKLTKTFMTLSLDDMAIKVGLANAQEAEKLILQMVCLVFCLLILFKIFHLYNRSKMKKYLPQLISEMGWYNFWINQKSITHLLCIGKLNTRFVYFFCLFKFSINFCLLTY